MLYISCAARHKTRGDGPKTEVTNMDEPNVQQNNTPAPEPEPAPEKTFTQAEMEAIIGRRIAKTMKGMPSEEELSAFRAWKDSQQTEKERWDHMTKERDDARAALAAAQAELTQHQREKFLLDKGISPGDVDYYAFKIGKLVTDDLPFEKAAESFLKERQERSGSTMKVDLAAPLGGGAALTPNQQMNSLIRGARN